MRIDRLLAITIRLLNRKRITARELAEYFEVSIRTIYRDIEAINMAGIPIVSFQGNGGGFGIMDNYKIDRQMLTLTDMLAMLSALKGINLTLEDKEIENAIEKISSLIPKEKKDRLETKYEQFVVDILPWGDGKRQKEKKRIIHEGITTNKLLQFTYRNAKGQTRVRTVEPMTLLFKVYTWYLFAFCRARQDYRLFRLSRMRDLMLMTSGFIRRDKSYRDLITNYGKTENHVDFLFKFSSKARVKVEDFFETEQISIQKDGSLLVSASFPEDEWIYATVLSFGEDIEVLKPVHVKRIIRNKAMKIAAVYRSHT